MDDFKTDAVIEPIPEAEPVKETKFCTNCANAIFCPTWAEYKCTVYAIKSIIDPDKIHCEHWQAQKPGEEKPCHCEDCESRGKEDEDDSPK